MKKLLYIISILSYLSITEGYCAFGHDDSYLMERYDKINLAPGKIYLPPDLVIYKDIFISESGNACLRVKAPIGLKVLRPDAMSIILKVVDSGGYRLGVKNFVRLKASKESPPVTINGDIKLTYGYKKEDINGTVIYTELNFKVFNGKNGKVLNIAKFAMKYELSDGVPVFKKFSYIDGTGKKYVYENTNYRCPATGKIELCIKTTTPDETLYSFRLDKGRCVDRYFYKESIGKLHLLEFNQYKKFGNKYKIAEVRKRNQVLKIEYYDNKIEDGKYYGKIKRIINPDLSEKRYTYFPDGIIKTVNTVKP